MTMLDAAELARPLPLGRGVTLKNRLVKSAMSEVLGTIDNRATPALSTLYRRWAQGGIGLSITGNVMIDRRVLGEPNNVVLEDERDLEVFASWAQAGTENGCHCWMQLNHPGKQSPRTLSKETVAPSAIPFREEMRRFFVTPRALSGGEVEDLVRRFATSAALAKRAGFTGVQIHGAHGYLVSQFLSPYHNQRDDEWGGSAEKRRRFVLEVHRAMRAAVGHDFPLGIKLNSADFQRGGFTEEESLDVIRALSEDGIDLIEISGGTYEAPVMAKGPRSESTVAREAYFLEFARKARAVTKVPLVVTGGFRTLAGMAEAVREGHTDLVGLARLLAVEPDAPARLLGGEAPRELVRPIRSGIGFVDRLGLMEVTWYTGQLLRIARGEAPLPNEGALSSLAKTLLHNGVGAWKTRRLRAR